MASVTFIPAKRQVGNNISKEEAPKLRVAAYCRVSTDSDEQETSYDAQVKPTTRSTFRKSRMGAGRHFCR
jgi:site-specific DNA recombinase